MKNYCVVRTVDPLGRVTLPIELREHFKIKCGETVVVRSSKGGILIKTNSPSCVFCDSPKGLITFQGKPICKSCCDALRFLTSNK